MVPPAQVQTAHAFNTVIRDIMGELSIPFESPYHLTYSPLAGTPCLNVAPGHEDSHMISRHPFHNLEARRGSRRRILLLLLLLYCCPRLPPSCRIRGSLSPLWLLTNGLLIIVSRLVLFI